MFKKFAMAAVLALFLPACFEARNTSTFQEGQVWTGHYYCNQIKTDLNLRIAEVNDKNIVAIFDFDENGKAGQFYVSGVYDDILRKLRLKPGEWIDRPPEYDVHTLEGYVSSDGRRFTGSISGLYCNDFVLSL